MFLLTLTDRSSLILEGSSGQGRTAPLMGRSALFLCNKLVWRAVFGAQPTLTSLSSGLCGDKNSPVLPSGVLQVTSESRWRLCWRIGVHPMDRRAGASELHARRFCFCQSKEADRNQEPSVEGQTQDEPPLVLLRWFWLFQWPAEP